MERTSKVVFGEISELYSIMDVDGLRWMENDSKSAAARVRKASLAMEKLCKEFRKLSIAETKK